MKWLAELIARFVLRKARQSSNVSAKEYEQWKKEYVKDFGKENK